MCQSGAASVVAAAAVMPHVKLSIVMIVLSCFGMFIVFKSFFVICLSRHSYSTYQSLHDLVKDVLTLSFLLFSLNHPIAMKTTKVHLHKLRCRWGNTTSGCGKERK